MGEPHRVTVFVMATVGPDAEQRLRADARLWPGIDPDGEVGVHGADAEEVARRLRRWVDAGADAVILQPTGDVTDHEAFVALAAQVAPHLAD